jgi:hypothetical protein
MLKRFALTGALTLGLQVLLSGTALAHSVSITAEAVCDPNGGGFPVINYTSTSWSPDKVIGENPEIDILFNGVFVASGAYKFSSGNTFSGSAPAPSGTSAVVTAVAVAPWGDLFGPGQTASVTVDIPQDCGLPGLGRFTGGGKIVTVGGVKITTGLTIHCDLLLSNNLEINWPQHKFHIAEHIQTVACTDDPDIIQNPPQAPLDTLIGVATGSYDNKDGFTCEFTLVDAGEPGTSDMAAFKIYETANPANVVLLVPLQILQGGNLQAHFDQPHK